MTLTDFMNMPMNEALQSMKLIDCKVHTNSITGELESVELKYDGNYDECESNSDLDLNSLYRKGGVV